MKAKHGKIGRLETAPLCLGGDDIACRVLAAMIASRSASISPTLVLLGEERQGLRANAAGAAMPRSSYSLERVVASHCEDTPARRKAACSAFFPVHRKTFDPGLSDSFLPPSIPRALPTAPRALQSNGEAADKGAFLQSGSPSSHKFSAPA